MFLSKKMKAIGVVCLMVLFVSINAFGQQLTHRMTEEEKAKMPEYLQQTRLLQAVTPPPTAPARNIAEFEPMEGALVAYPLGIPVNLVKLLAEEVMVTTIVDSSNTETTVRNLYSSNGVDLGNCNFLIAPHDSYWTRDYGPWYVTDGLGNVNIMNFTYNRPRNNDNNIPVEMGSFLGINVFEMDIVHTGGNYMTDGYGNSVSTDLVWEENNDKTTAEIDQIFQDYLGIDTYHVRPDPQDEYIKHVDCWAKYLDVDKILVGQVDTSDNRYADYEAAAAYFAGQDSGYGNKYQVYRVYTPNGEPYTNSLIMNKRVYVPIAGTSNDSAAITTYQNAMPGYTIIGVTGDWLATDALHCRVKDLADRGMLHIGHMPLLDEKPEQSSYQITADIIPYSGQPVISSSVKVYYNVNGGAFTPLAMTNTSGNTWEATLPGQVQGNTIGYYIHAEDNSGRTREHPLIGSPDPHTFVVGPPPQPPVADFSADSTTIMEGNSVQFTDLSTNEPTTWSWSFTGGTPSTSSEKNPAVTYAGQGTFTVALTVTNAAGNDTETKVDYITVLPPSACLGDITNSGFETGDTTGWAVSGDVTVTSTSHTGSYGISVNTQGSEVEQVITGLCPNTSYTVSAWGIARSNAGVYLGVKDFGGTTQTAQFIDSKNWQQKSITFTTGASSTTATIYAVKSAGGRFTGNIDDFELILAN
jgi:PKD repeat protein/agmatine/peptidylarginine deiminase